MDPFTKPEILAALAEDAAYVTRVFSGIPAAEFAAGDARRWGPAHHLDHLRMTCAKLAVTFRAASRLPAHATGRSRRYAEVCAWAGEGLAATSRERLENNPLTPEIAPDVDPARLVEAFVDSNERLREAVEPWNEADLDRLAIPHPFFGPMTAREMLLFVLCHDRHHVKNVKRRLSVSG